MKLLLSSIFTLILVSFSFGQTLIMNEVSQGVAGNMEYVEFVVVDETVVYDCFASTPPSIDIRGWIFDDNSGYHGGPTGTGIAPGAVRFSFDPLWSAVPMGTIILIYNDVDKEPSIPADDVSLVDGNCVIIAPISDVNLFESNATTPGADACSYPASGWTPGGDWGNTLLANTGDCARIVNLSGCEVFSVCYGTADQNTSIYFSGNAGNKVFYFNDGDPNDQLNWDDGCTDDETILDANSCGSNDQTPGAPNNALNAAYIAQFNNGCVPITPIVADAIVDQHELCGCDGQATASGSGSIPGYTYEWQDEFLTPIGQTSATATNLCPGVYNVVVTSSIGCSETAQVTINPTALTPISASILPAGPADVCAGSDLVLDATPTGGSGIYSTHVWSNSGAASLNNTGIEDPTFNDISTGSYDLTYTVTDDNSCSATANITVNVTALDDASFSSSDFCESTTNSISSVATPGGTFSIQSQTGSGLVTIDGGTGILSNAVVGDQIVISYLTNATCPNTSTQTVNVIALDDPSFTMDPGCTTASATVIGVTGGTFSFAVLPSDGALLDANGNISNATPGNTYSVLYQTNGMCPNNSSVDVTTIMNPSAPTVAGAGAFCSYETPLTLTSTPNVGGTITWYDDNTLTNALASGNNFTTSVLTSSVTYYVTESFFDCESPATAVPLVIDQCDSLLTVEVPNVFTVNGDGVNDKFTLMYDSFKSFNVVILNRWGNVMFEASDLTGIDIWDGYNNNGNLCNEGVYFYKIDGVLLNDTEVSKDGFVTLWVGNK